MNCVVLFFSACVVPSRVLTLVIWVTHQIQFMQNKTIPFRTLNDIFIDR